MNIIETCAFIPLTATGISTNGISDIANNSNITFGDSNRTMITIERLLKLVEFQDDGDTIVLKMLEKRYGPLMYIDLEN